LVDVQLGRGVVDVNTLEITWIYFLVKAVMGSVYSDADFPVSDFSQIDSIHFCESWTNGPVMYVRLCRCKTCSILI